MILKNVTYSSTGTLMNGKKNIRTWAELLELTGYKKLDTLKNKLIGKVDLLVIKYEKRTETLLVATQEQAGNKKKSDYQIKTFEDNSESITCRNQKNIELKANKIFFDNVKQLNETLNYLSDGKLTTYDFMVIDLEDGKVLLEEKDVKQILINSGVEGLVNHLFPNRMNLSMTPQTEVLKKLISEENYIVSKKKLKYDIIQELDLLGNYEPTDEEVKARTSKTLTKEEINEIKQELLEIGGIEVSLQKDFLDPHASMTHYNDAHYDKSFYVTENDISNLDLFFMSDIGTNRAQIIREPFFNFSVASFTKTKPIYQLGSKTMVTINSGITVVAGRIVLNAFHNVPLINTMIATKTTSARIEDIPPLDLYIINKNSQNFGRRFQDLVIKNVKFTSFNFEQGLDPGRYFVIEYMATDVQGIHLKDYIKDQVYNEFKTEIDINDDVYEAKLNIYNEELEKQAQQDESDRLQNAFNLFLNHASKYASYEYPLGSSKFVVNAKEKDFVDKILTAQLSHSYLTSNFQYNKLIEDYQEVVNTDWRFRRIYIEDVKGFVSPVIDTLSADNVYTQVIPQLEELMNKLKSITTLMAEWNNQLPPVINPELGDLDVEENEEIFNNDSYKFPRDLNISNAGISLIKKHEGFHSEAYYDVTGFAIGYGTHLYENGSSVKKGDTVTRTKAESMLKFDLDNRRKEEIRSKVLIKISQAKYDALSSLLFNIGSFSKCPKLLSYLNQGQFKKAAEEFDDIIKADGVILDGLVKRRAEEKRLFLSV